MEYSSVAFCLVQPLLTRHQSNTEVESNGFTLTRLTQLCDTLVEPPCHYEINEIDPAIAHSKSPQYQILLTGPTSRILAIQRSLLQQYPSELEVKVKMNCCEEMVEDGNWRPEVQFHVDDIIRGRDIAIEFVDQQPNSQVVIKGRPHGVEKVRQDLVRLEEDFCRKAFTSVINVEAHMLRIISGPNDTFLKALEEELHVKIDVPLHYGNLLGCYSNVAPPKDILISGEKEKVELATQRIEAAVSKTSFIVPATSIILPTFESSHQYITIYGQNEIEVSRTTKAIMQMTSDLFSGWLWLESNIPSSQPVQLPKDEEMNALLSRISQTSGTEVIYHNHSFEVSGEPAQLKAAFRLIGNEYSFQLFQREIKLQVELAIEHREFISGKKNGKINKIMKVANVKIGFENFNDCNFFINIYSPECNKTLEGLKLLQEELPAELSFYVPESYHKRIIGVGGKNIQRIMKQFGVYVKFSTAEEFAAQGVCISSGDNVVARTPAKNACNLDRFKQTIVDLVENRDQNWSLESMGDFFSGPLVAEPTVMNNTSFERKDSGFDTYDSNFIAHRMQDLALNETRVRYPSSTALYMAVDSEEFRSLVKKMKQELNIILIAPSRDLNGFPSMRNKAMDQGYYSFILKYEIRETALIPAAQQMLDEFLSVNHVPLRSNSMGIESESAHYLHRSMPISAPGNRFLADNRSYSLFDQQTGNSFFESTPQFQVHQSAARVISESFFDETKVTPDHQQIQSLLLTTFLQKNHKNATWNSSLGYNVEQPIPRNPYNHNNTRYNSQGNKWPLGVRQEFNPFQNLPTPPRPASNSEARNKQGSMASFYSGYYGF
ncbi:hypothetical protein K493DRAFT_296500 [Basidiobolus meristosporus CBS 931.73]|uniref:K Homology domain-containing protein n=1 Tax=Basidiobolus meristosporus CBS 931.73 TaxID=1314790 RepID=A0A1Y1Z6M6_9FUNG|nr:hypothetical protein K493DRAFT_296500 [Basidiobolus meristosporus CBS 931.73]|eukprot:ORY05455.1 hypothetical protein K493DRAFT_296500 [Basidiobolus meristosporus CBS 931.73]